MESSAEPLALYIHWPFCLAKCPYCDFNSHVRERIDQGRFAAALRAVDLLPGRMVVERIARLIEGGIARQFHRQIFFRHRHDAARRTMDHRDRTAPVALARDAPVAQAEVHLALGERRATSRLALQPPRDIPRTARLPRWWGSPPA